jgi:hypothetical protein
MRETPEIYHGEEFNALTGRGKNEYYSILSVISSIGGSERLIQAYSDTWM